MQINKLALLAGLLLTACVQSQHNSSPTTIPPTPEPDSGPNQAGVCDGLGYYQTLSRMTPVEKKQALPLLRFSQYIQSDSCGQLELAMLLSQLNSDSQNDIEAERLLGEFLDNPNSNNDNRDRALAILLRGIIQERLRSQKVQNALKRKIKQEQNASLVLKKRLQELKSQLEQLKSLERDINQQEQAISSPRDKAVNEK